MQKGSTILKRFVAILLAFGFLFPTWIFAYDSGGYAGSFLRMGLGARAIGMGNAFTAVPQSAFAGFYNPGGLPFLESPQLAFSGGILSLDRTHNYVGFSTHLRPPTDKESIHSRKTFDAGFSIGWVNSGVSNIDGRDSNGMPQGSFSSSENAFLFSFAIRPLSRVAVGFSAKVLYTRLPKVQEDNSALTTRGMGLDFGIMVHPIDRLFIGTVLQDVRSKYSWNTEHVWERGTTTVDQFPKVLRVGGSYGLGENLLLSVESHYNFEQGWRFYSGAEYRYRDRLVGRIGFKANHFTFGLGVLVKLWKLNSELAYAYDANPVLPWGDQFVSWMIEL